MSRKPRKFSWLKQFLVVSILGLCTLDFHIVLSLDLTILPTVTFFSLHQMSSWFSDGSSPKSIATFLGSRARGGGGNPSSFMIRLRKLSRVWYSINFSTVRIKLYEQKCLINECGKFYCFWVCDATLTWYYIDAPNFRSSTTIWVSLHTAAKQMNYSKLEEVEKIGEAS